MSEDFNSPSDKKCRKCNKVLTQGEKKACYGRNSSNPDFLCNPCYYNREKPTEFIPTEQEEYNRLNDLIHNSQTLTELENNYQTVKNSPLYDINKKTWVTNRDDNKTSLDKTYNSCKGRFCTSCLNHAEHHQPNCSMKCKKCNYSILKEGDFRCLNLNCDNYWCKHDNIPNINPVDNNHAERERESFGFFHQAQYQIHYFTRW